MAPATDTASPPTDTATHTASLSGNTSSNPVAPPTDPVSHTASLSGNTSSDPVAPPTDPVSHTASLPGNTSSDPVAPPTDPVSHTASLPGNTSSDPVAPPTDTISHTASPPTDTATHTTSLPGNTSSDPVAPPTDTVSHTASLPGNTSSDPVAPPTDTSSRTASQPADPAPRTTSLPGNTASQSADTMSHNAHLSGDIGTRTTSAQGDTTSDAASRPGALEGIRLLDLTSVGPGARATRLLADYGADVVKVGPVPRRSAASTTPPPYAYSGHRNMRRTLFDLKDTSGRAAFLALASGADVVIESFRPGVVDRLGVGYNTVRAVNERIVYCSISGFGQDGPRRLWAGHDLNYLAVSGYLHCSGRRADGVPALPGATVADIAAGGMQAAMAVMAALMRRERTGVGEYLDVSVADGALAMMSLYADEHLATGVEPGPGHYILTGRYACYDVYGCADGRYLTVAAIEPAFWANLCRALDLDRYIGSQTDDDRQDEIRSALTARFATADRDYWVQRLGPADCCVSPVNSVAESVHDEQYLARDVVIEAEHSQAGRLRQLGPVWAGTSPVVDSPCRLPDPDQTDTASLLAAAGYDHETLATLSAAGVIA